MTEANESNETGEAREDGERSEGSDRRGGRRGGRRLEMIRRRLDLTDEQVATLREKFAEHRKEKVAIVRDVLDDEQRAKFDRHLADRRQHRHGGHGPHGRRRSHEAPTHAA